MVVHSLEKFSSILFSLFVGWFVDVLPAGYLCVCVFFVILKHRHMNDLCIRNEQFLLFSISLLCTD